MTNNIFKINKKIYINIKIYFTFNSIKIVIIITTNISVIAVTIVIIEYQSSYLVDY